MIIPYIIFHGKCREALDFYQAVFDCPIKMAQTYDGYIPEDAADIPPDLDQWILHAELEICGTPVWFADEVADPVHGGDTAHGDIRLTITVPAKKEAQEIFDRFKETAHISLPPTETFYSTFHAEIFDKYGIGWDIVAEDAPHQ